MGELHMTDHAERRWVTSKRYRRHQIRAKVMTIGFTVGVAVIVGLAVAMMGR
jgi:hypothetical protein